MYPGSTKPCRAIRKLRKERVRMKTMYPTRQGLQKYISDLGAKCAVRLYVQSCLSWMQVHVATQCVPACTMYMYTFCEIMHLVWVKSLKRQLRTSLQLALSLRPRSDRSPRNARPSPECTKHTAMKYIQDAVSVQSTTRTLPCSRDSSSIVTKYAGMRCPHHNWRDIHQSL